MVCISPICLILIHLWDQCRVNQWDNHGILIHGIHNHSNLNMNHRSSHNKYGNLNLNNINNLPISIHLNHNTKLHHLKCHNTNHLLPILNMVLLHPINHSILHPILNHSTSSQKSRIMDMDTILHISIHHLHLLDNSLIMSEHPLSKIGEPSVKEGILEI